MLGSNPSTAATMNGIGSRGSNQHFKSMLFAFESYTYKIIEKHETELENE
jgi:hypothetical protein